MNYADFESPKDARRYHFDLSIKESTHRPKAKKKVGKKVYCCEFCGIYTAAAPNCNQCEQETE